MTDGCVRDAALSAVVIVRHLDRVELELFSRSDISLGVLAGPEFELGQVRAALAEGGLAVTFEDRLCPWVKKRSKMAPFAASRVAWPSPCCSGVDEQRAGNRRETRIEKACAGGNNKVR